MEVKLLELKKKIIPLKPETEVFYGYDITRFFTGILNKYKYDKIFFIADKGVFNIHGYEFYKMLIEEDITVKLLVIDATEDYKTIAGLEYICTSMIADNISKDSIIISFGGGVTGNICGMAAALIYRGVRYIEIPTTFMGQTDSTLSNKQAVNGSSGKNQLGMYYAPIFVWTDIKYAVTEKHRHIKAAITEGIKNALIYDKELLPYFTGKDFANNKPGSSQLLELFEIITNSKNKILSQDPGEKDYAVILEYGHTFGHAIEYLTHGEIIHGEAVAAGMCIAAEASFYIGKLSKEDLKLHYYILYGYIPQIILDNRIMELVSPDKIIAEIQSDNKRSLNGIRYILLEKAGSCINPDGSYQVQLDNTIVKECINRFFKKFRDISNKAAGNSFVKLWNRSRDIFSQKISKDTLEILEEFFGEAEVPGQLKNLKLHHVALYAGDYHDESQIHGFARYLKQTGDSRFCLACYGPSYIAAKEYGTPGWWFTINTGINIGLELFTCESFGAWKEKEEHVKTRLMSHYALRVDLPGTLEALVKDMENIKGIKKIMYTEDKVNKHVYAHFKNLKNNRVLELIYCGESNLVKN